jgi:hypothetical protein
MPGPPRGDNDNDNDNNQQRISEEYIQSWAGEELQLLQHHEQNWITEDKAKELKNFFDSDEINETKRHSFGLSSQSIREQIESKIFATKIEEIIAQMNDGEEADPDPSSSSASSSSSSDNSPDLSFTQSGDEVYYEVYFKCSHGTYRSSLWGLQNGDYVAVEADRGYDIGIIYQPSQIKISSFLSPVTPSSSSSSSPKILFRLNLNSNSLISFYEILKQKIFLENKVLIYTRNICSELNINHLLNIIGTEFQYDRKKLTIYYQKLQPDASLCKLIRKLFAVFKIRIWMENIRIETGDERLGGKILVSNTATTTTVTDLMSTDTTTDGTSSSSNSSGELDILSTFEPNVKKYLELSGLDLTVSDVYIFVPGMKEKWSMYEENRTICDENTDLLSSFENKPGDENGEGGSFNLPMSFQSPSSPSSSSSSVSPLSQHGQSKPFSLPLDLKQTPDQGKGNKKRNSRPKPQFVHSDYLKYQPQQLRRQQYLPSSSSSSETSDNFEPISPPCQSFPTPPPQHAMPLKLSHLPAESFHQIPYSPPTTVQKRLSPSRPQQDLPPAPPLPLHHPPLLIHAPSLHYSSQPYPAPLLGSAQQMPSFPQPLLTHSPPIPAYTQALHPLPHHLQCRPLYAQPPPGNSLPQSHHPIGLTPNSFSSHVHSHSANKGSSTFVMGNAMLPQRIDHLSLPLPPPVFLSQQSSTSSLYYDQNKMNAVAAVQYSDRSQPLVDSRSQNKGGGKSNGSAMQFITKPFHDSNHYPHHHLEHYQNQTVRNQNQTSGYGHRAV